MTFQASQSTNRLPMLVSFSVHQTILYIFAVISVFGNSLLISLILHRRSLLLGAYRWLLLAFAVGDIIISVYHCYVLPTFYQIEFGLVVFTWAGLYEPPLIGFMYNTLYCLLFYEPFVLLTFHFIYRYLILVNPTLISYRPVCTVLSVVIGNLLFSTVIAYDSYLADLSSPENFFGAALLEEYGIDMTTEPRPNVVPINYVHPSSLGGGINWNSINAVRNSSIAAFTTLAINTFCSIKIRRAINTHTMASQTKRLQEQLFRALIVQFAIPFALCFIPFSAICLLPLTGIRFGETGNIMGILVSLFPSVDPFMVLFMISRFRAILADWIRILAAMLSGNSLTLGPHTSSGEGASRSHVMKASQHRLPSVA